MSNTSQRPSRFTNRQMGFGAVGLEGDHINVDGKVLKLRDMLSSTRLTDASNQAGVMRLIKDLVQENIVLYKLVVELLERVGPKIVSWNEYHRGIVSTANKITENPDDIHLVLDPIMERLSKQMITRPTEPTRARHQPGHPDDSRRDFLAQSLPHRARE